MIIVNKTSTRMTLSLCVVLAVVIIISILTEGSKTSFRIHNESHPLLRKAVISTIQFKHGRYLKLPNCFQFDWSAISFYTQFSITNNKLHESHANKGPVKQSTTSNVILSLQDHGNWYNVYLWKMANDSLNAESSRILVDTQILVTNQTSSPKNYTVSFTWQIHPSELGAFTSYEIEVEKRTEAFLGIVSLYGMYLANDDDDNMIHIHNTKSQTHSSSFSTSSSSSSSTFTSLHNTTKEDLIVEFLGDSLSCAYGNLGHPPCAYTPSTQDVHQSFVIKTAQYLQASEYHVECWSGKGVVRNFGENSTQSKDPFPYYYPRTIANSGEYEWNYQTYIPHLVVITLGGNDFSTSPRPSFSEYYQGYLKLLEFIFSNYEKAQQRNVLRETVLKPVTAIDTTTTTDSGRMNRLKVVLVCGPLMYDCYENFTERVAENAKHKFGEHSIHFLSMHNLLNAEHDIGCAGHPNTRGDEKMARLLSDFIKSNVLL
ncbi:hypothetical protein C9374_000858 [Naegleria lovaniensis]|uniref:SGNH hydrolase-type esterase domain-containing protein n=1 Tax=Naegleria lovaniensis TaxID=51637 RepID=A0AA88GX61_NAELO|nr:uncharacterized protein C9374_000858 [Naegleria lovaniensis]KAG2388008.1 hypothetical protein C9374_000858 [Naegleria lovaniensis]